MFVDEDLCVPLYMPPMFYLYFIITYIAQYHLYLEIVYFERQLIILFD